MAAATERAPARPLRVVVQGLGAMGAGILRAAHEDPRFEVVGAVDVADGLVGRAVPSVAGGGPASLTVRRSIADALDVASVSADVMERVGAAVGGDGPVVLLHATGSKLDAVAPELEDALARGLHVVSTCEELAWPFERAPAIARRLHEAALGAGRTLVGTGVNPGFVMDRLVVTAAAATRDVRRVDVARLVDPRPRRAAFQHKVGFGVPRAEWDALVLAGRAGHVGLPESARLVAAGLGWTIARWTERFDAVAGEPGGPLAGVIQSIEGATEEGRVLRLRFEAHAGITESRDLLDLEGTPPVHLRIEGGLAGDGATAATVLSAAAVLAAAPRGLVTVLDLPLRAR